MQRTSMGCLDMGLRTAYESGVWANAIEVPWERGGASTWRALLIAGRLDGCAGWPRAKTGLCDGPLAMDHGAVHLTADSSSHFSLILELERTIPYHMDYISVPTVVSTL